MSRICLLAVVMSSLVVHVGCDEEPDSPEAAAIRQVYETYDLATQNLDGEAGLSTLAQRSIDYYDGLIAYALNGTHDEVFRLSPIDRVEIVRIRNRIDPAEVKKMSGRDVLLHAFDEGWYYADPDEFLPVTLGRIDVAGDYASAMVLEDGEKTGHFLDFYLENGEWKLDFQSWDTLWNKYMDQIAREFAKEEGMSMDDMILFFESWDYGYVLQDVERWKPIKDWR